MPVFGFAVFGRLIFALVFTFISAAICIDSASAQQPSQQNLVQQFLQDPPQILRQYPNGGTAMISHIRELAISDTKTLDPILGLLPNANKDHKAAIGSGLGQAAKVVVRTNQAYANQILQAIAATKDQDVFLAYSGVSPDQGTASTGGGGAGGGGAVGGQTNSLGGTPTSTGTAQGIGGGSDPTSGFTYTPSTTAAAFPGTSTTGGTTTNSSTILQTVSQ